MEVKKQGKICSQCKAYKLLKEYNKDKSRKDGKRYHCKSCHNANVLERREANPEKERSYWVKTKYNLSPEQYKAMLDKQANKCADCRTPFTTARASSPQVDHDHECCASSRSCGQCVRALICHSCNRRRYAKDAGVGMFRTKKSTFEDLLASVETRYESNLPMLPNPDSREIWDTYRHSFHSTVNVLIGSLSFHACKQ